MFAIRGNRLAGLLREGADLAVEFATLGEYRLPERDAGRVGRSGAAGTCGERAAPREEVGRVRVPRRPAVACAQRAD